MIRLAVPYLIISLASTSAGQDALVRIGDPVPGVGFVEEIFDFEVNDEGDWLARVRTSHADSNRDVVILKNGEEFYREGVTFFDPPGLTATGFGSLTLNAQGSSAMSVSFGPSPAVIYVGPNLVLEEGATTLAAPLPPGTRYTRFLDTWMNDEGDALLFATLETLGSKIQRALIALDLDANGQLLSERVVALEDSFLPGLPFVHRLELDHPHYAFNDVPTSPSSPIWGTATPGPS